MYGEEEAKRHDIEAMREYMGSKIKYLLTLKYEKLDKDYEMHYNIILGFEWISQSMEIFLNVSTCLVKDRTTKEDIVQQIPIAFRKQHDLYYLEKKMKEEI